MMPHLSIDFGRRQKVFTTTGLGLLCIAVVLLLLGAADIWHAYREQEQASAALMAARHHPTIKRAPVKAVPTAVVKQEEKQSRAVLRELAVPWQGLLAAVEDYPSHDVALIGIDQVPSQSLVHITAETKDVDTMIAYLKYLQGSKLLYRVALSEYRIEDKVPGTPVRFQIAAAWRSP
ncbi:hypothetical protein [Vogesella sp. LIG4]|uniref:hypothetical protein n=1 Tax=Vogesella sp. LIG4 TaxID=1192162 RepID=UPI00081FD554|nr:hypothetical protein [Vogesella sp. LIG4]SCK24613.1 hypothetical protein PSELUDRAFT_2898 [Vogesella sp. LIG4]